MKVKDYILERVRAKRTMHMTLIDPVKQSYEKAADIAACAERLGTDAIMVGGSTNVTQENLDNTVLAIKKVAKVPVIYFPSGAHAITRFTDAIYFMSMLNSRNRKNIIGEQVMGAPIIARISTSDFAGSDVKRGENFESRLSASRYIFTSSLVTGSHSRVSACTVMRGSKAASVSSRLI